MIASEIERWKLEWLQDEDGDGLKRYDKLLAMQERSARIIASYAVKLRLTPSTRIRSETAATIASKASGTVPWDYPVTEKEK